MKLKEDIKKEKRKIKINLTKKAKIGIGVVTGLLAVVTGVGLMANKNSGNFYSQVDEFIVTNPCEFRYVFSMRSTDFKGATQSEDLEKLIDEGIGILETEGEEVREGADQTEKLYKDHLQTEWSTTDGALLIDFTKPNYELVVEGVTVSTDPVKMKANLKMTTNYTSLDFTDFVIEDGVIYYNLGKLRTWLLSSKDSTLIAYGKSIADGITYVSIPESEIKFGEQYADSEEEIIQGTLTALFKKERLLSRYILTNLKGTEGLTKDDDRYKLNLTGQDGVTAFNRVVKTVNSANTIYDNYINKLKSGNIITEEDYKAMQLKKDNYLYAIEDIRGSLSRLSKDDITKANPVIIGKARKYGEETKYREVNIAGSIHFDDTEYVLSFTGCKNTLTQTYEGSFVPTESIITASKSNINLTEMQRYLLYYFRLGSDMPSYSLNNNLETVHYRLLKDFCKVVNEENKENGYNLAEVNMFNIQKYIDTYINMTKEEQELSPANRFNSQLVEDYRMLTGNDRQEVEQAKEDYTANTFVSNINGVQCKFEVNSDTTMKLLHIDVTANSDTPVTLELSKMYILDSKNNKYPANYSSMLHEIDSAFDLTKAPESIEVNGTVDTGLYFVIQDYDTYTLYYDKTNLGVITEVK